MLEAGFIYDNSMTANPGISSPPYWPQTLDFEIPYECQNGFGQCPKGSHPGIWEIPLNQLYGYYLREIESQKRGSMLAAAMSMEETEDSLVDLIRKNFHRAYRSNKAPYVLALNADFLTSLENGSSQRALERFLQETLNLPDVWYVTMNQLILWMQRPVPIHQIESHPAVQCMYGSRTPPPCRQPSKCIYKTPFLSSGDHLFKTCGPCPRRYPWLDNPEGLV